MLVVERVVSCLSHHHPAQLSCAVPYDDAWTALWRSASSAMFYFSSAGGGLLGFVTFALSSSSTSFWSGKSSPWSSRSGFSISLKVPILIFLISPRHPLKASGIRRSVTLLSSFRESAESFGLFPPFPFKTHVVFAARKTEKCFVLRSKGFGYVKKQLRINQGEEPPCFNVPPCFFSLHLPFKVHVCFVCQTSLLKTQVTFMS